MPTLTSGFNLLINPLFAIAWSFGFSKVISAVFKLILEIPAPTPTDKFNLGAKPKW